MSDRMSSATLNITRPSALAIRTIFPRCGQPPPPRTRWSVNGQDEEKASTQAHRISGRARAEARRRAGALHADFRFHVERESWCGVGALPHSSLLSVRGKTQVVSGSGGRKKGRRRKRGRLLTLSIEAVKATESACGAGVTSQWLRFSRRFHHLSWKQRGLICGGKDARGARVTHWQSVYPRKGSSGGRRRRRRGSWRGFCRHAGSDYSLKSVKWRVMQGKDGCGGTFLICI